jgi:hypothetical protein
MISILNLLEGQWHDRKIKNDYKKNMRGIKDSYSGLLKDEESRKKAKTVIKNTNRIFRTADNTQRNLSNIKKEDIGKKIAVGTGAYIAGSGIMKAIDHRNDIKDSVKSVVKNPNESIVDKVNNHIDSGNEMTNDHIHNFVRKYIESKNS